MAEAELRYPSLRVVMQYLEANKRIHLARRCPSLYHVERSVPISMNILFLGTSAISINSTNITLGIIRHSSKGGPKILNGYKTTNELGGAEWDLDEYGKTIRTNKVVYPGDIPLESADAPFEEMTLEEETLFIVGIKRRVARLKSLRKMRKRKELIDEGQTKIYEWNLRQENKRPPYSMYLQCLIEKNGRKSYERMEYDKKLYEADKYLSDFFFGGRKHPVRVKDLYVTYLGGALRLPEAMKINARQVYTGTNFEATLNGLQRLLVHQNFEMVTIWKGKALEVNYNHPAIRSAKHFMIYEANVTGHLFHLVLNDTHMKLTIDNGKITKVEYLRLINRMIEDKRAVGTWSRFGVHSKDLVKQLFKDLKERDGVVCTRNYRKGSARFRWQYSLPINEMSTLTVYCLRNSTYNEKKRTEEPWKLWIQVDQKTRNEFAKEFFIEKMNEAINEKPEIGAFTRYKILSKKVAKEIFDEIENREGVTFKKVEKRGCTRFPYTYALPIDEKFQLSVFISRNWELYKDGYKKDVVNRCPWFFSFCVERRAATEEITVDEYKNFLIKIFGWSWFHKTQFRVAVQTKKQVKNLLNEMKNRSGVTFQKQNRGSHQFPYTYICPLNVISNIVVYCSRKKDYNEKDPTDKPWIIWHYVEKAALKKIVKSV